MNPQDTVYITTPISEPPNTDGTYMTKWKGVPAFTEKEFKDGKWQTRFDWTGLMTHWLKPVKLSEITTSHPVKPNEDILVKALEKISISRENANHIAAEALSSYRTALQGLSGKEIGHYEYDKENEDFKIVVKGEEQEKGWIKVEEGSYPPHNIGVLVLIPEEDYHVTSGMWDIDNKWVLLDEYRVPECEVTHWMHAPNLPDKYEKERKDQNKILRHIKNISKL